MRIPKESQHPSLVSISWDVLPSQDSSHLFPDFALSTTCVRCVTKDRYVHRSRIRGYKHGDDDQAKSKECDMHNQQNGAVMLFITIRMYVSDAMPDA